MSRLIWMRLGLLMLAALSASCKLGGGRSDNGHVLPPDPDSGVQMRVVNALPPGQSGLFTLDGQAVGTLTGDPADFGEHVDDQRLLYWNSQFKAGGFQDIAGREPDFEPREGVRIYLDEFGVPAVHADSIEDVWFGAGYIMATQRLFLMDGVRRQARGTLAELSGPEAVPQDIQARVLTYTQDEYLAMFEALSETAKASARGYVDGVNQRIQQLLLQPHQLPAEYVLLQTLPQPLSITDVLAAGVLMTREVASDGGNEMDNVLALRALEGQHGQARGRDIFQDVMWVDDEAAAVSIPASEGRFSNISIPAGQRETVFQAMADFAAGLPEELAEGPGTGDAPVPEGLPLLKSLPDPAAQAARYFSRYLRELHGGSYMVVVNGGKSANGRPLMFNGPQLGYSYPSLLVELEVHAPGLHARGATVPGLPVVGIGYNQRLAWGVTTGFSKTIDSFIEDTSVGEGPNQYQYQGQVRDMNCREETVNYREAPQGVPIGPAILSETVEVCRTVHGPVVARSADGSRARSVQYAMWMREVETIEGIIGWMQAQDFADFRAAMAQVTWNENTMYADADGNIAYFHPGLHPRRHPTVDPRLPARGDGSQDHQGLLAFAETPQIVNPARGWLVNWNNKPAVGWDEGVGGSASTRPAAPVHRALNWERQLAAADTVSFEDLIEMDRQAGREDPRATVWMPLIAAARDELAAPEQALADLLLAWDRLHYNPDIDLADEAALDRPAETIFDVFVRSIRELMFGEVLPPALFSRMRSVGGHEYDISPLDFLVLKTLDPTLSAIALRVDYTQDLSVADWVQTALAEARARLESQFGSSDPQDFRRVHHRDEICSLTGGIIGPCTSMPHQDRGTWNHLVGFEPGS